MIVHQIVPTFEPGAVGAHALLARRVLRAAGHESEIFAAEIRPEFADRGARTLDAYRGGADILVYQMAIGSVAADEVLKRREPLVVNYHNLTPVRFWSGWEPVAAGGVVWGLQQLHELAHRAALGIAVSQFNVEDLVAAKFPRATVVPFLIDVHTLGNASSAPPRVRRGGAPSLLFVGRLAPNKAQHDLVKMLAAYRRLHAPGARLTLVGGGVDGAYGRTLRRFVHALDLDDAVSMPGAVAPEQLAEYYETADVFVVVSEHEGFCVPLLEAMYHRRPIVAYGAAAVPETLAGAGLVLGEKDPYTVAAAVQRVVTDGEVRERLVAAGERRLRDFALEATGPAFASAVASAVA